MTAGTDKIGVGVFMDVLLKIGDRKDVQDVFVEIHECPDPDAPSDNDTWMTSMAQT